jgi:hypothetical protein
MIFQRARNIDLTKSIKCAEQKGSEKKELS